ncbi:olfactory receptor 10A6-like [Periophthalmus magnuspinnatus]|uniref:olfactory receptor 10A6-like n=1 Tax=Periophthalmus magnuspinnatus TaxID=409849 RepID=UPI00145A2226|nr:olfactory receptor 10A6-like [Periophthalmus magnuspinnatus]
MSNQTHVSYFILTGYFNVSQLRYLIFVFLGFLYTVILFANIFLITVISMNRTLHEPMFVFLCSLFLNEIYGSTSLFPFLLFHMLRDVHTVSHSLCFLQIFCLYSYATVEFFSLAVMSYDRYVAVCFPLQYHLQMNTRKVLVLIVISWSCPVVINIIPIILSAPLKLCGNIIPKVYCDNYFIVSMACSNTRVNNIYGLIATFLTVFVPVTFILFTYLRILFACFHASPQTKQKALSTCMPHFVSLINFSFGVCFEILQSRFNMSHVPNAFRVLLSLYWLVSPSILNPFMYGLNSSKVKTSCINLFGKVQA